MEGISMLLISAFSWSTLYFTLCILNPKRSYEWHIRTVTTIHALAVSCLGLYSIFALGPWPFTSGGEESTPFQHFVITLSLAYFLLDLSWCLYFKTEGPVMLLHHSLSIIGLSTCFVTHWWGTELVTTIFGAEITNPLLQLRWFLRETKNYDTFLGDLVDVAFMTLFGIFRIGIGSYLLYCYYQLKPDFWGRFGGTAIYSVGWLFWISIVKYGIKRYRRKYGDLKGLKKNGSVKCNGSKMEVNGSSLPQGKNEILNGSPAVNGNLHRRHVTDNLTNGLSGNEDIKTNGDVNQVHESAAIN